MAPTKLEAAKSAAFVESELCSTLYKAYGEAVKTASANGVPADKDADAKKALKALNAEYGKFKDAVDALQHEIDAIPINSPDSAKAKDAAQDVDLYKKVGLVVFKRAEEYWQKTYPVKKKK